MGRLIFLAITAATVGSAALLDQLLDHAFALMNAPDAGIFRQGLAVALVLTVAGVLYLGRYVHIIARELKPFREGRETAPNAARRVFRSLRNMQAGDEKLHETLARLAFVEVEKRALQKRAEDAENTVATIRAANPRDRQDTRSLVEQGAESMAQMREELVLLRRLLMDPASNAAVLHDHPVDDSAKRQIEDAAKEAHDMLTGTLGALAKLARASGVALPEKPDPPAAVQPEQSTATTVEPIPPGSVVIAADCDPATQSCPKPAGNVYGGEYPGRGFGGG